MKNNPVYSVSESILDKYNLVYARKAYRLARNSFNRMKAIRDDLAMIPERRRLRRFKNLHADRERYFIIGNGLSIRQQDLTKLRDEITFATNWFMLHEQFEELNIKYYQAFSI